MAALPKRELIVFVKAPLPGDVKTRLIPQFTSIEAADLYRCFVADILSSTAQLGGVCKTMVAYQSHPKAADLSWLGGKARPDFFRQEGRSLGERLIHAFGTAFGRGARQIVLIGSDSPNLPPQYIEQAFQALSGADVVLGPANGGGYYLVGLSRPCLHLFDDVIWSSDQVFERTCRNATSQGYTLRVLPSHYGVDTMQDLHTLCNDLSRFPRSAPATHRFLAAKLAPASV
jgi:rSAM/selenodomain-associated transferase 1